MEILFLTSMIVCLFIIFAIDTMQKRHNFMNKGK